LTNGQDEIVAVDLETDGQEEPLLWLSSQQQGRRRGGAPVRRGLDGVGRVAAPVAGDARRPAEKEEATAACMLVVLFVSRMARGGLETTNDEEVRADGGGGARWSSTMRPRIDDEE